MSSMTIWRRAYVGISETPETAPGIHGRDHVRNDSNGQKYQIAGRVKYPTKKRSPPAQARVLPDVMENMGVSCICLWSSQLS